MPFYWYKCEKCKEEFKVFHRMSETVDSCKICDHDVAPTKLVTKPLNKNKGFKKAKVGDITKEYIKANKEILESEKNKAKEDSYDPSLNNTNRNFNIIYAVQCWRICVRSISNCAPPKCLRRIGRS